MSAVAFDVAAVRARFSALENELVFFDGPGGSQVPDEVIAAIADYLRTSNANVSGPYSTSRRTEELVNESRLAGGEFLGCSPEEVVFGANMTTLNFALSRTVGRELEAGDEIVVTQLDHDGNVSPWLELARDLDLKVRVAAVRDDTSLDLDDLQAQLSDRTRVVAFPWASNAVGTLVDVARVAELAHSVGALAWVDAVHYAPHGPIDVGAAGADVLVCSPYKFFGPHLGIYFGRKDLIERWRPYKVRPADNEPVGHRFETGTLSHEALAGTTAAITYIDSLGWDAMGAHERGLGQRFLDGLTEPYRLHGVPTMEGRVPTFSITHPERSPDELAVSLGKRGIATWPGNFYAVEVMKRLGLPEGTLRIGFVHYNSDDEVDRVLDALNDLA
jgi:cysteine desulfurase family protein (TIGR01976 family)